MNIVTTQLSNLTLFGNLYIENTMFRDINSPNKQTSLPNRFY